MIPIWISSPIFVRGKINITTQKIVSIPITISAFIQYQLCGCLFFHYTTDWLQDAVTVSLQHKNIHVQQSTWVQRVHRLSSHTIYLQDSPVLYKNIFFCHMRSLSYRLQTHPSMSNSFTPEHCQERPSPVHMRKNNHRSSPEKTWATKLNDVKPMRLSVMA